MMCVPPVGRTMFLSRLFIHSGFTRAWVIFSIEKTQRERAVVATHFCKCFCFAETMFAVLQCYHEMQSVMSPVTLCIRVKFVLLCLPVVCGDVHPGFGMNYIQDLGVEET